LIAFLPAVLYFFKTKWSNIKELLANNTTAIINSAITLLWLLAIVLTLSRTAFIG